MITEILTGLFAGATVGYLFSKKNVKQPSKPQKIEQPTASGRTPQHDSYRWESIHQEQVQNIKKKKESLPVNTPTADEVFKKKINNRDMVELELILSKREQQK